MQKSSCFQSSQIPKHAYQFGYESYEDLIHLLPTFRSTLNSENCNFLP